MAKAENQEKAPEGIKLYYFIGEGASIGDEEQRIRGFGSIIIHLATEDLIHHYSNWEYHYEERWQQLKREEPARALTEPLEPFSGLLVRNTLEQGKPAVDPELHLELLSLTELAKLVGGISVKHESEDIEQNKIWRQLVEHGHNIDELYELSQQALEDDSFMDTETAEVGEDDREAALVEEHLGQDIDVEKEISAEPPEDIKKTYGRNFLVDRIGELYKITTTIKAAQRLRSEADQIGFFIEEK